MPKFIKAVGKRPLRDGPRTRQAAGGFVKTSRMHAECGRRMQQNATSTCMPVKTLI